MQHVEVKARRALRRCGLAGIATAATLITCSLLPSRAAAQNQAMAAQGRVFYEKYCTPCHGPDGAPGSAKFAKTKEPVDLRTYVQRHGGQFPAGDWLSVVFAETPHNQHTAIWQRLKRDEPSGSGSEAAARGKVRVIADYIVSIQTKQPPSGGQSAQ